MVPGEAGQWTEIGTGDTYTVSKDDIGKQIKFEVIPKSDAADPGIQTGEAAEAITEVIPATDLPGTAMRSSWTANPCWVRR